MPSGTIDLAEAEVGAPGPDADADADAARRAKPTKAVKPSKPNRGGALGAVRKRWRAWLRAVHRDIGYLAVGFTMIYALSGIAMNHIEDWDPNFHATELTQKIAPIADDISDAEATRMIAVAAGVGADRKADDVYRAGDEVRVSYGDGTKLTAIGDTLTVQRRRDRFFFRVADWLHATRGKQAWKFIADAYAVLLLYLAISGIFMIKGRLGLRWRGTMLIVIGLAGPIAYIVASGGPGAQKTERVAVKPGEVDPPKAEGTAKAANRAAKPAGPTELAKPEASTAAKPEAAGSAATAAPQGDDGIKPLPPDDDGR